MNLFSFLSEFDFSQIVLLTFSFTLMLGTFFYFFKRFITSSKFNFNLKTGEFSTKEKKEEDINFKSFLKDIYLIENKIIEMNSKKEYLNLIENPQMQMNSAEDHLEKRKAQMRKMFLDRLDNILREQNMDVSNVVSHKDFITFDILLIIIYHEARGIIYNTIKDENFIHSDVMSIEFKEFVKNKIEKIINTDNSILNQYYINVDILTRTEVYKLYKENEEIFRELLNGLFYDIKQINDRYINKIKKLNNDLNIYINTYINEGIEEANKLEKG